ncbi:MAG: AAA family ATPase [Lachnospiraceae bacterium]|nr:AAA family ATPase [Lachnospiraceae bacterium]
MGFYLNSKTAYMLYRDMTKNPYFVDKTKILKELIPPVDQGGEYICITRPRRFGKTIMANMIVSFFGKGEDSRDVFDQLNIAKSDVYEKYRNQYDVIHISFNDVDMEEETYESYIQSVKSVLKEDLRETFPELNLSYGTSVIRDLLTVTMQTGRRFLFVLDEWDYIFHQDFVTEEDKKKYLAFLRLLLKDKPYVQFAYMTGILPIAKYSSGSELNMFSEYTMATEHRFSSYFGFREPEVDILYDRYSINTLKEERHVSREGLKYWYDGYYTKSGERIYNPRSVVLSLTNNNLGNYWTSAGPYDEIFYYIKNNIADVRDSIALMVSGIQVPVRIQEYAATSQNLETKDEIFSAMVVYGFLSYEKGKVCIPNKELMDKFDGLLQKERSLGYVYQLARASEKMLEATLAGDTKTMAEILSLVHDTETPLLKYNNETELTAVVNLVYLAAREFYRIEREEKAGVGYVDFIFYPEMDKNADCIILELKVDASPEEAIEQIRCRKYAQRFQPKLGEKPIYTGRILAVGISYDRKEKVHRCRIEEVRL